MPSRTAKADGPDPIDVHVGGRVRARRLMRGLSQTALAHQIGLTFQQLQKYESGANRISCSKLWHISNVLTVPPAYFFRGLDGAVSEWNEPLPAGRPSAEILSLVKIYNRIPSKATREATRKIVGAIADAVG